jgi:hypothetical protein
LIRHLYAVRPDGRLRYRQALIGMPRKQGMSALAAALALDSLIVHKIGARAERRLEGELVADLKRVRGKEGILCRLAQAAVDRLDDTPGVAVPGGRRVDPA